MGKTTQAALTEKYAGGVGRWWGTYYRNDLPFVSPSETALTEQGASRMMRLMRRYAGLYARSGNPSLTIFCEPDWWLNRLPDLVGEPRTATDQPGLKEGLGRLLLIERQIRGSTADELPLDSH